MVPVIVNEIVYVVPSCSNPSGVWLSSVAEPVLKLKLKSVAAIRDTSLVKAGSLSVRVKVFLLITRASLIKGAVISFKRTVEVTWLEIEGFPTASNIAFELIVMVKVSLPVALPSVVKNKV